MALKRYGEPGPMRICTTGCPEHGGWWVNVDGSDFRRMGLFGDWRAKRHLDTQPPQFCGEDHWIGDLKAFWHAQGALVEDDRWRAQ